MKMFWYIWLMTETALLFFLFGIQVYDSIIISHYKDKTLYFEPTITVTKTNSITNYNIKW
jgi:hypothetical protein